MYRISCDKYPLYDARDESLLVINPKVKLEVNTVGEGSFTIYKNHPYFDKLKILKSIIEISDEIGVIFRGRMTENTMDFQNGKAVDLEGSMAFFNDSIIEPFSFPEDFLEDEEYITAAESGNVIKFFLNWLIEQHNSQVDEFQQLKLGKVTVTDPNNYLSRSSTEINSTWDVLKSKLFESALGGYLCIRYEDDGNYIDYLSAFELTNTQSIDYGKNLLDLKHGTDANATYSAIYPIGAELEETATSEETGAEVKTKRRLTLEKIPDGELNDDLVKQGKIIYSKSARDAYGFICAPIKETTWDDVTEAANLLLKATVFMTNTAIMLTDTVEITAADLHFSDEQIRSFRIYRFINVGSLPHGLNDSYELKKLDIDLLNPQNTKITIGETKFTLTEITNQQLADNIQRIEIVEKDLEENRSNVTEVKEQLLIQSTTMINTCEEIIFDALQSYTESGDFESFKETVETQLTLLAGQMEVKISETVQQIVDVDGDLQEKFNTITKYFTFDINGLTIGQLDNPFKVIIDNDKYRMTVNDVDVLWLDPDGKSNIPELSVSKMFNLLGYLIDQDESGNVNCEYVGGDS